jgi:type IV secretory pathway VirB3-like protein
MANDRRFPTGFGCLSTIIGLVVLAAVVVLFFFVGFIALVVVAVLLVVGLIVWAVDRVLLAISPKRRERRADRSGVFVWQFGQVPPDVVIDTTATESTVRTDDPGLDDPGPDELGRG